MRASPTCLRRSAHFACDGQALPSGRTRDLKVWLSIGVLAAADQPNPKGGKSAKMAVKRFRLRLLKGFMRLQRFESSLRVDRRHSRFVSLAPNPNDGSVGSLPLNSLLEKGGRYRHIRGAGELDVYRDKVICILSTPTGRPLVATLCHSPSTFLQPVSAWRDSYQTVEKYVRQVLACRERGSHHTALLPLFLVWRLQPFSVRPSCSRSHCARSAINCQPVGDSRVKCRQAWMAPG